MKIHWFQQFSLFPTIVEQVLEGHLDSSNTSVQSSSLLRPRGLFFKVTNLKHTMPDMLAYPVHTASVTLCAVKHADRHPKGKQQSKYIFDRQMKAKYETSLISLGNYM